MGPTARRVRHALAIVVSIVVVLVAIVAGAVLLISGTDWGRERVRRFAQNAASGRIHGKVSIGGLTGNLLVGMTAHDVTIADSSGAPFVSVESFSASYSLASLLQKRVWIDGAVAVRPRIVLDRPPNGAWNWQRIFPRGGPTPAATQPGWLDRIRFSNASVVDGQLVVRTPWTPNTKLGPRARDSVIKEALAGMTRLMITKTADGYQKLVQLDSVTAHIPLLRLSEPGQPSRLVEVSSMSMNAFPFRPPGAVVRDINGVFSFNDDSAWWKGAYVAMPKSTATGDGSYVFSTGDLTVVAHGDLGSLADMRWVYGRLPADGRGTGDLRLTWRGALQDYVVTNTNFALGAARFAGTFGVSLGDTIAIHDTHIRFSKVDTRTIEQVVPRLKSPRAGTLSGNASARGGIHALAIGGDITFDDRQAGVSRVSGTGQVGLVEPTGIQARDLRLQLLPLQVTMARTWYPSLPVEGTVTGSLTINGSTKSELTVVANLDHRDRGTRSVADGSATIHLSGTKRFDVNVDAKPVSLEEIGRFAPAAGLQGTAIGPVHLTGALNDLHVNADMRLPDGGRFTTTGTLDLAAVDKGYDLTSSLYTLNLRTIDSKAPVTSLTARAAIRGHGFQLATMNATASADLSASRWHGPGNTPLDSVALDTMTVRASVADGVLSVERLYATGAHTTASVSGTLGLAQDKSGTLTYKLSTDSLGAFNRLLPRADTSTPPVQPRPGVIARAFERARSDSSRIARATEMQRLISGRPGPRLAVNAPKAVPSDTLSGSASAAGTIGGNIYDLDLKGTANGENVVARGNFVRRLQGDYEWAHVRTPHAALSASVHADSLSAMGFAFDTLSTRVTYTPDGGHVELTINQSDNRRYAAKGDYVLSTDSKELHLSDLSLRFDTTSWTMTRPSLIQWGGPGVRVDSFELRNGGNGGGAGAGRVFANGLLPTEGVSDFALSVENFPVANVVDILQTDIKLAGIATLNATMAGTLSAPAFRATFGVTQATYNGVVVPAVSGRADYANRLLVAHVDAQRKNGQSMTTIDGRVPVNLAITGVTGSRLLPDPMSVDLVADSLPLELIPQFTDLISNFHGRASGKMTMRGTVSRPALTGGFTLDHGSVTIASSGGGAKLVDATAAVHMANDTVYVDSVAARTVTGRAIGTVTTHGTLAVGSWREPALNLYFVSNGAQLMNNRYGNLRFDAGLAMTGPFRDAYLSGAVTLVQGVIYAPEPGTLHHLLGASDPALYNVLDTASSTDRDLFPAPSPLLANLRVEVAVAVKHDTWVRNREANIEIYTDDPLSIRQEQQALIVTGEVATDRGEYEVLSKRFQIKRGSAQFIGSPDLDPTLQITGEYQVSVAARGALNIRVIVGGTLRKPKLSLESDAQPPKTQSELLSLLAFGQSSTTLIASNSSSITGSAATSDLFGVGAQAAVQRLAGVALGVAVQQVEMQAGRAFGTDVFDITPGDVPLFTQTGTRDFFTQTRVEAGKYVNPRTFVSAQEQAGRPGLSIEHRTADGWRFNASMEPRILLGEPTLSLQPIRTVQSYGWFVLREWRF